MARDRSDTGWSEAEAPYERLQWARKTDGRYPTPTSFAKAIGVEPHTYAKYERDPSGPNSAKWSADRARQFAEPLQVRWEWLMWGEGSPWIEEDEPAQRISAAMKGMSREEQERIATIVELASRTGTGG